MARVSRVAASNTPTNPGEDGSATPKPMMPCSRKAPSTGTASPKARKHTAKAAAFTTQSTTDHRTTAANRAGFFNTSSPATRPSAMWVIRSAIAVGRIACVARRSNPSHGDGQRHQADEQQAVEYPLHAHRREGGREAHRELLLRDVGTCELAGTHRQEVVRHEADRCGVP